MVVKLTGVAGGKNENTTEMSKKHAATMFMKRPDQPSDHGPKSIGSLFIRLSIISTIAVRYEMKRPAMVSETMALKATVEPMLMRPMIAETTAQKPMDRRGSAVRLSTWERKPENGSPLSLANAQVCREAEARKPNEAQVTKAMSMAVMTEDPARDLVAPKNTWMKSYSVALIRSVCKSPKAKEKATQIANPKAPFSRIVDIIAQGTTVEALRTSSARWHGPS